MPPIFKGLREFFKGRFRMWARTRGMRLEGPPENHLKGPTMFSVSLPPVRAAATAALLLIATVPGYPAFASAALQEAPGNSYEPCPLTRIGTQLVRCDNLTGAGAEAPYWIPEQ